MCLEFRVWGVGSGVWGSVALVVWWPESYSAFDQRLPPSLPQISRSRKKGAEFRVRGEGLGPLT